MLWFILAVMTGVAVLAALWPLAFRRAPREAQASEAAFYRAQLAEIERDVERGQLPPTEAASARAEAGRRLISASASTSAPPPKENALARRRAASLMILIVVPTIALGLYGYYGSPDIPDAPLAERKLDASSPGALEAAIAKIEAHLATSPDDARGWAVLAPVYMRQGRFDDAVAAFRQLLRLKGESGDLRASYGEALVAAAGGVVTADARSAFDTALADSPGLPMARFYLALAAEQDGDAKGATQTYEALLPEAGGSAPWMIGLRARLAALKGEPPQEAGAPGPAADAQAPGGFTAEQRTMIQGMVAQLANRLAQGGGSAEEWARLIRAYSVLHETDKAKDALAAARKAFANDAAATANFAALAHELGLGE